MPRFKKVGTIDMSSEKNYQEFVKRLDEVCTQYNDKIAIEYMRNDGSKTTYTFGKIKDHIIKAQDFFERVGLRKSDRVAIIVPHSPFAIMAGLSLAYSNLTSVLIDASLPEEEINRLLEFSDVRAVFTTPKIHGLIKSTLISDIPVFNSDTFEFSLALFADSVLGVKKNKTIDPHDDVIAILFSSGTTTEMKGVMITYTAVRESRPMYYEIVGATDNYNLLFVLPFNHVAGFFIAFQYFLSGCGLGLIEDVDAAKISNAFQTYHPDFFALVPKFYEIVEQKIRQTVKEKGKIITCLFYSTLALSRFFRKNFGLKIGKYMFNNIRRQVFGGKLYGLASGGSMLKETTSQFFLDLGIERWGNFYALTETYVPTVVTGVFDRYPAGTEGRVNRFEDIDVKIHNPDKNGNGEIRVKTALIMKGYFRDSELTAAAFDEDGYFKTGDLGYIDKKDYLHVTGRIKEAIMLHTGKKVAPSDVDVLYSSICNPDIILASCGVPSKNESFDEIYMFIESGNLSPEEQEEIKKSILDFSAQTSTLYQIANVHFIEKIPTTSVGKVKRFQLREIALSERAEK